MLSEMTELPTVQIGDYNLHLELEELKPEAKEIARKELRETPDVTRDAVATLRDLLKGAIRYRYAYTFLIMTFIFRRK
jgi:hypothetical protein